MAKKVTWHNQLGLAAALLVLGGGALWLDAVHRPKKEAEEASAKKIFPLKDVAVEDVKMENSGTVTELVCSDAAAKLCKPGDNSKWQLAQPMKIKADDSNGNSLLSTLNNLVVNDVVDISDEKADKLTVLLGQYGLDPGARAKPDGRRVTVKTAPSADGKVPASETTLYLGNVHPTGEQTFGIVARNGKIDETKVYLVPNYFKTSLDHNLTYWREKKILTLAAHDIASFQLELPKLKVSGEKKDGSWVITSPALGKEAVPGDIENIDAMLSAATYLTAKEFVDPAKQKEALKGTKLFATLTMAKAADSKEAPVVLKILARDDKTAKKLYATVSNLDPVYEIELSAKDRFDKTLKDLRLSKLITSMDRFQTKRLEFDGGDLDGKPFVISQDKGQWTGVDNAKVNAMLDRLSGGRVKDFLTGKAIPADDRGALTVTLLEDVGKVRRKLKFWQTGGKFYAEDLLAKHAGGREVLLVDEAIRSALPWNRVAFEPTAPSGVPSGGPKK